ncbi:Reverse transcriptase, RNase H-like domain [Dillenia turbinata]|uniref:Reverse transcriptase, RNase H-like domain n=1 Tax=Dillenia turbinata TaxID=194707 RepID=A0AAN8VDP9_9MAGN
MLEKGFCRPSTSRNSCSAFIVAKHSELKRGKSRLVINYKPLNDKCHRHLIFFVYNLDYKTLRLRKPESCKTNCSMPNTKPLNSKCKYKTVQERIVLTFFLDFIAAYASPYIGVTTALTYYRNLWHYQEEKKNGPYTDEPQSGYVAVLTFNETFNGENIEQVARYTSRKFNQTEQKYTSSEKEFLSIIKAIKTFEIFIIETIFKIRTDSKIVISWIKNNIPQNNLSTRILKWKTSLSNYTFEIEYVEGKDMNLLKENEELKQQLQLLHISLGTCEVTMVPHISNIRYTTSFYIIR